MQICFPHKIRLLNPDRISSLKEQKQTDSLSSAPIKRNSPLSDVSRWTEDGLDG